MASKNKKAGKQRPSSTGGTLRDEVLRLFEKGHLKDAVKQAKIAFRDASTEENRRLLERAYFLRAQQLQRNAMPSSAHEVAQHLLDFGVTDPALAADFIQLLLALGLAKEALALQGRLGSPEAKARVLLLAADQAVLHPERGPLPPEVQESTRLVRSSFEALEAGDEAKALTCLREIPRGSPFADWRYFVRGLAAYYRHDAEEMRANWDRLDPDRAACRIARSLRALADPAGGTAWPPADGPGLGRLEGEVLGEQVLARIRQMRDLTGQGRWREAFKLLGEVRDVLRRIDPTLPARITRVLYVPLMKHVKRLDYNEARILVGQFTRFAEPLPIDPRWNRLWALLWEGPRGGLAEAEAYWRDYLKDLDSLPVLADDDRRLAKALVWRRLGELFIDDVEAGEDDDFGRFRGKKEAERTKQRAIECLQESLRACPTHLPTHVSLYRAHDDWEQPDLAAEAARGLLERFPDDLDALLFLATHYLKQDEPDQGLEFAHRAHRLKPLSGAIAHLEWSMQVESARHHALAKRWAEGRAAFQAAETTRPSASEDYTFLARRAVFELKAGQAELAEPFISDAQGRLVEPTPLWLVLLIEAIRYRLGKSHKDRFADQWKAALKKKCRSETAGEVASVLDSYLADGTKYTGRDGHVNQVVAYLRRTSRVKFQHKDLRRVCEFLDALPDEPALLEKMVDKGYFAFPDSAYFHFMLAELAMRKPPYQTNLEFVRKDLERALKLAEASSDPADIDLRVEIKENLTLVSELGSGPRGMPFSGRMPMPMPMPRPMAMPFPPDLANMPPEIAKIFREMQRMGIDPQMFLDQAFDEFEPEYDEPHRPPTRRKKR